MYVHAYKIPLLLSLQTIVVFSFPFGYSKCSSWKIKFSRQAATAKYRIPSPTVNCKVCLSGNVRGDDGDPGVNGRNLFHERVQLSERFNLAFHVRYVEIALPGRKSTQINQSGPRMKSNKRAFRDISTIRRALSCASFHSA